MMVTYTIFQNLCGLFCAKVPLPVGRARSAYSRGALVRQTVSPLRIML
jgi:hypothetical protein